MNFRFTKEQEEKKSYLKKAKRRIQLALTVKDSLSGIIRFAINEKKQGRFGATVKGLRTGKVNDISWAQLLEEATADVPSKNYILYKDEAFTYRQMDDNANKIANFLLKLDGGKGKGLGIFMRNSPRFLDIFFGAQKVGMYLVPINPELKGEGLAYIINHCDIEGIVIDAELITSFLSVKDRLENIKYVIADDLEEEAEGIDIPKDMKLLGKAYDMPSKNPGVGYNSNDICLIMYTSGTTGRPKGVVYRYKNSYVTLLSAGGNILLKKNDIYYTYLALCHGNALFMTVTSALASRNTVALSRKFSASRFWDDVCKYNATVLNTIGSIVPILMKQPEKPTDNQNKIRVVVSAACPTEMWEKFEKRFGVRLYEGYGAVDGGGKSIINLGQAPIGSLGKLPKAAKIIDEDGNSVLPGISGELVFKANGESSHVEYYNNEEASKKKSDQGYLRTGDLVKRDNKGFVYFVGRNTESMRKGGENVSAYEVEHVIMKHPAVEEVAAYAVPSDLIEDEIMVAVKLVNDQAVKYKELRDFLSDKLAKYAIPRYIRFVDEFPKTNTHRIMKRILEEAGVTEDTFDANADN